MFNLQGSEIVFLLLIALVVLGPEKLPEAVRKFAKGYAEFRKMATGFQGELKSVLDEPMRELRGTADAVRQAVLMDGEAQSTATPATGSPAAGANVPMVSGTAPAAKPADTGLDFGNVAERRRQRAAGADGEPGADSTGSGDTGSGDTAADATADAPPADREPEPWE
ncbi:MAG: twin-arginine translocase TatA/TatE family subunit [Ilumatobacteraceae bacterium]